MSESIFHKGQNVRVGSEIYTFRFRYTTEYFDVAFVNDKEGKPIWFPIGALEAM